MQTSPIPDLNPPRPPLGRLARVCLSCGDTYGYLPCPPAQDGAVTHGFCDACRGEAERLALLS